MPEKKKYLLRIEDKMYSALEKWAADDFRSLNAQIEFLLNEALKRNNRLDKTLQNRHDIEIRE